MAGIRPSWFWPVTRGTMPCRHSWPSQGPRKVPLWFTWQSGLSKSNDLSASASSQARPCLAGIILAASQGLPREPRGPWSDQSQRNALYCMKTAFNLKGETGGLCLLLHPWAEVSPCPEGRYYCCCGVCGWHKVSRWFNTPVL